MATTHNVMYVFVAILGQLALTVFADDANLIVEASENLSLTDPVTKVLDLISDLQQKVIAAGETATREHAEFAEWCEDRSRHLEFEIKTGNSNLEGLKASIEEEVAQASAFNTQIEKLVAKEASDKADLKSASAIRATETADFAAEEQELTDVVDTLERATRVLQRGGPSLVQLKQAGSVMEALSAMVQASVLSSADSNRLSALVQSSQESDESAEDDQLGAPDVASYKSHSEGILQTLEDLLEKAHDELASSRNKELSALHNFQMLQQSLVDSLKVSAKDLATAKKGLSESDGQKAVAQGELDVVSKEVAEDMQVMYTLKGDCQSGAADFEAGMKSRSEELKALAAAKQVLSEKTGGAASIAYGLVQTSLIQISRSTLSTGADLASFEAVRFVRDLAQKTRSPELAELASRMSSAMRLSGRAIDPFSKIKDMISNMIASLERSARSDATHKEYCDTELSYTQTKKSERETTIQKLSIQVDRMSAHSTQLEEEVSGLQSALADLAAAQLEMMKLRQAEKATFLKNKADTRQGIEGVKRAVRILGEYYAKDNKAHDAESDAATGIIGLLEVVESDFSQALTEMIATEETAATTFELTTKDNEIEKVMKDKDVDHKTAEIASLAKTVAAARTDRSGVQAELDALSDYLAKLKEMCIAKAEPYQERARRRAAEISGLKEALAMLEGEAVLLQQTKKRALRGLRRHA